MDDREQVTIDIKSTADTSGLDQADKKQQALGKSASDAGSKSLDAAKGFGALGQAAAASGGGIGAMASALGNMAQQIPALAGAAGPIGLAIAAFIAWKTAIEGVNKMIEEHAANLRDIQAGNFDQTVKKLASSYDDLTKSLSAAADARQRLQSLDDEQLAADRKVEDAKLELEKQQALAAIAPEDDLGRRRVETDFASRSATIGLSRAQQDEANRVTRLRQSAADLSAAGGAAGAQLDAIKAAIAESLRTSSSLTTAQSEDMNSHFSWNKMGITKSQQAWQPEIDRQMKVTESLTAQLSKLEETVRTSGLNASDFSRRADIAAASSAALAPIQTGTAAAVTSAARADISHEAAKRQAAADKIAAEIEAKSAAATAARAAAEQGETSIGSARNRRAIEAGELDSAQDALAAGSKRWAGTSNTRKRDRELAPLQANVKQQESELRQANTELVEALKSLGSVVKTSLDTAKKLEEEVKQLRARQKQARIDSSSSD